MKGSILLQAWQAETTIFGQALADPTSGGEKQSRARREIRLLIRKVGRWAAEIEDLFDGLQKGEVGSPLDELESFYGGLITDVDDRVRIAERLQVEARRIGESTGKPVDESPLIESIAGMRKVKERIAAFWTWMSAAPTTGQLGRRTAAERRAAFERGEYQSTADLLAQNRPGNVERGDDVAED